MLAQHTREDDGQHAGARVPGASSDQTLHFDPAECTMVEIVRKLCLSPEDYERSIPLKEWVQKNKDQKYVPVDLLRAWDFVVKGDV